MKSKDIKFLIIVIVIISSVLLSISCTKEKPKKTKYVDLSISISNDALGDPKLPEITYINHKQGAETMKKYFKGLEPEKHLPDGNGWAVEWVKLNTHHGTHLDAPYHYSPFMNRATKQEKAWTIDQIPLEWCFGNLVVLDFSKKPDGYLLTKNDIKKKLKQMTYMLKKGDIVTIHTSAAEHWGKADYFNKGCGVSKEATLYILSHGINVVGTDAWSWDAPFKYTNGKWKKSIEEGKPNGKMIWEGHFAGIEKAYCHMEKLTNLDKVPSLGAKIYCFPIKIEGASGGWIRAIAEIEE
ncbi:MAG: cyclase family protein [Proteobacteria bacterium]|nr:cyclase family protein [Pseudomonadota bacterium]